MSKISDPSTKKNKDKKSGPLVLGEYRCQKQFLTTPVTRSFLISLGDKLVTWSMTDEALHLSQFFQLTGVPKSTFYDWVDREPELKSSLVTALENVGARREIGAITKKYDTAAVWKRLYQFAPEYKEAMIFAASLAKKDEAQSAQQFIVLPNIKSSEEFFSKRDFAQLSRDKVSQVEGDADEK